MNNNFEDIIFNRHSVKEFDVNKNKASNLHSLIFFHHPNVLTYPLDLLYQGQSTHLQFGKCSLLVG